MKDLQARARELVKQAVEYSGQAVKIALQDQEQSRILMQKARDASKRYQVLIQEILRQQN
jgi:hypothetical protein